MSYRLFCWRIYTFKILFKSNFKFFSESVRNNAKPKLKKLEVFSGISIDEISKLSGRDAKTILSFVKRASNTSKRFTSKSNSNFLRNLISILGYQPVINENQNLKDKSSFIESNKDINPRPPPDLASCSHRPPVVAIMGHVDHGKTTLLDALRATHIVDSEFGGITQHLSAFTLSIEKTRQILDSNSTSSENSSFDRITFLDTPGHATFSAIRSRGANVTDIVILVVAADDGVMPQTIESIRFAQKANSQIIVAINKIDKLGAEPELVIDQLASHGVIVEQLGGDIQCVHISALKKKNLVALLESIIAQAEIMDIKADFNGPSEAVVLESKTHPNLGKVATLLVTRGELFQINSKNKKTASLVAEVCICRPRIIINDLGRHVTSATPGEVVEVVGWQQLPPAGEIVLEVENENKANEVVKYRKQIRMIDKAYEEKIIIDSKTSLYREEYQKYLQSRSGIKDRHKIIGMHRDFQKSKPERMLSAYNQDAIENNGLVNLPILVKVDVHGSLEAIRDLLTTIPSDNCKVDLVHIGVGPLTEADVGIAESFNADIFLFNSPALKEATSRCSSLNLKIHEHKIIYRMAHQIKSMIQERLPPVYEEANIGEAIVLQMFEITEGKSRNSKMKVAGSRCVKGNLYQSRSLLEFAPKVIPGGIYYRILRGTKLIEDLSTNSPSFKLVKEGLISRSLRHQKQTVDSIKAEVECGISLGEYQSGSIISFEDIRVGDRIECYQLIEIPQTFQWEFGYLPDKPEM